VATDPNGNFVTVWENGTYGGRDVYARLYDADGAARTDPILVHDDGSGQAPGDQYDASVSMDPAGDFVVSWTEDNPSASQDIFAQRFLADGTSVGGAFLVNDQAQRVQGKSSVAVADNGKFVISWAESEIIDGDYME